MSHKQRTVRYNNQKWVVDKDSNTLTLQGQPKVKVDIDEVWMSLCDSDQNTIAEILSEKTDEFLTEEPEEDF
jgi:hypothetical protein